MAVKDAIRLTKGWRLLPWCRVFKVYMVDSRNNKVLCDGKSVVAKNGYFAMLKAGIADIAKENGLDWEQINVYAQKPNTTACSFNEMEKVTTMEEQDED